MQGNSNSKTADGRSRGSKADKEARVKVYQSLQAQHALPHQVSVRHNAKEWLARHRKTQGDTTSSISTEPHTGSWELGGFPPHRYCPSSEHKVHLNNGCQ